jgi:predicted GH43/DUF377 family glycosyl hydrolase
VTLDVRDAGVELRPDPSRTLAHFFLPGESAPGATSRVAKVGARVLALPRDEIDDGATRIDDDFSDRHDELDSFLGTNGAMIRAEAGDSDALRTVFGAAFTAESAVEGAALCNPSVVAHPDQSALPQGSLRVVVSLRSIGEGHVSTLSFCSAVIGPGRAWAFEERALPLAHATVSDAEWDIDDLRRALEYDGTIAQVAHSVLRNLPSRLRGSDVERVISDLPDEFFGQFESRAVAEQIRQTTRSAYEARFEPGIALSRRVLSPVADDERYGMEDARFVRFTDRDGSVDYRATYTAYDRRSVASRSIVTTDFETFSIRRLTGPAATSKGMAFFPRHVGGRLLALTRADGESISLAVSDDGRDWQDEAHVYEPTRLWEVVQSGNCGSPLETDRGWLVLTHGVGPMRRYSIGAILLDLDDPSRVLGVLETPLLEPSARDRDGYVPNVVYSCGSIAVDGLLWIPYGIADQRIRVASVPVEELLDAMAQP